MNGMFANIMNMPNILPNMNNLTRKDNSFSDLTQRKIPNYDKIKGCWIFKI